MVYVFIVIVPNTQVAGLSIVYIHVAIFNIVDRALPIQAIAMYIYV